MSFSRADIKTLRLPIAVALALVCAGIACVFASDHFLSQAHQDREVAKLRRVEAEKRVAQVSDEEREIRQNLLVYQSMADRGMATEQHRLDLIDSITRIRNERRLFDIRYSIEPQKRLDLPGIRSAGPMEMVASRMKLEMLLLHEQDLLGFLEDLRASRIAYISVRGCSVSRNELAAPALAVVPRLRATCVVDLVSLKTTKAP